MLVEHVYLMHSIQGQSSHLSTTQVGVHSYQEGHEIFKHYMTHPTPYIAARAIAAAATPPAAQRALPVIMGKAALGDEVRVWVPVAAALLLLPELVKVPVAVLEAEVVMLDPPVEEAVEAVAEAPVVGEAPAVPVAVILTGRRAPPGIRERGTPVLTAEVTPLSIMVPEQVTLVASYLQRSSRVL